MLRYLSEMNETNIFYTILRLSLWGFINYPFIYFLLLLFFTSLELIISLYDKNEDFVQSLRNLG